MKTINFFAVIFLLAMTHMGMAQNTFPDSGNVGIGTSSPTASLHVDNGHILVENGYTDLTIDANITSNNDLTVRSYGDYLDLTSAHVIQLTSPEVWVRPTDAFTVTTDHAIFRGGKASFEGNVGIGTTNPTAALTVAGRVEAREVLIATNVGADFVFATEYQLPKLEEVEKFVKENKHLPEIASEAEMQEKGVEVSTFQIQLLQKIEELTLYSIDQNKRIKDLESKIEKLQSNE